MGYLIDTSVFIAWERGELDHAAIAAAGGEDSTAISAITASELLHGVERAESAQRRAKRSRFVEAALSALPVLPFDLDVSRVHARIWADLRAKGELIGSHDLLIAATAIHHGLQIATCNERHFKRIEGLVVVRW